MEVMIYYEVESRPFFFLGSFYYISLIERFQTLHKNKHMTHTYGSQDVI